MKLFGLTGGIGMGKSTAGDLLRQRGVPVVDTDAIAREIVEPGQPALEEIRRAFGDGFIDPTGCLRRTELGRHVFGEVAARRRLEAILHPRIRSTWQQRVELWRHEHRAAGVVLIPLLFETDAQSCFDFTLCLACSAATQRQRLVARGWSANQIEQRMAAQWPIEKKMASADFVIWTEGVVAVCAEQLERVAGLF